MGNRGHRPHRLPARLRDGRWHAARAIAPQLLRVDGHRGVVIASQLLLRLPCKSRVRRGGGSTAPYSSPATYGQVGEGGEAKMRHCDLRNR